MAKLLKNFRTRVNEAEARTLVVAFGRFNPPTTGHEKLIKAVEKVASKEGADFQIYPTHSQDPKKNPLSHADKVKFLRKMFRKYSRNIIDDKSAKTMFNIASTAYRDGYRRLIIVAGGDRIGEFKSIIPKYNGVDGRHGFYDFEEIKVVSAGDRVDPDSDEAKKMTADSMSASVLRKLAVDGHFDNWVDDKGKEQLGFKHGVPDTLGDTDKRILFNKVRTGMKLAAINEAFSRLFEESVVIVEKAPPDEKIQNWLEDPKTKDEFKSKYGADWEEIMYATAWKIYNDKKGMNEAWNVDDEMSEDWSAPEHKKLGEVLAKLRNEVKQDKDIKEQAKMAYDEPKAYKPAPVDASAKTKPSQHTKKFNKMFGESLVAEAKGLLHIFEDDEGEGRMVKSDLSKMISQAQELMRLIGDDDDLPGWAQNKFAIATDYINAVHGYLTYNNEAPKLEQFVFEAISQSDLNGIEKYADRIFAAVGIDVNFTRHFLDRVNDTRNQKDITVSELIRLFKQTYQKYGKKIARLGPDAEAVLNDMMTDINMPFVLKWDDKSQELDLVAKTVMRKKNFATTNQKFVVNDTSQIDEAKFAVELPQMPTLYVDAGSKQEVKTALRKFLKKPDMATIEKVKPTEVRKDLMKVVSGKSDISISEDTEAAIRNKADDTGISYDILKKVFDRGVAAWKTGHKPGTTAIQWGLARINSFATGGKTQSTADADLWAKHKKTEEVELDKAFEALEYGSPETTAVYKEMTPGEVEEETTAQFIAKIAAKTIKKKPYERAAEILRKVMDKKEKEGDKRHDALYYAAEIIRQMNFGTKLDARILGAMVKEDNEIAEALAYSFDNNVPIHDVFRPHSENYYKLWREARDLGVELSGIDKTLVEQTDIGVWAIYEDTPVPLDIPLVEEAEPELNSPKRGGDKKFYVYVRNDKGNVIKVQFGDTTGLKAKINDPGARKSFVARHQCDQKKDKTTPGYWACRLPMYAKELGLEGGGDFFW